MLPSDLKYCGIPFTRARKDFTGANCVGLTEMFIRNEIDDAFRVPDDLQTSLSIVEFGRAFLPHLKQEFHRGDILFWKHRNLNNGPHVTPALSEHDCLTTLHGGVSHIWTGHALAIRSGYDYVGSVGPQQAADIIRSIYKAQLAA